MIEVNKVNTPIEELGLDKQTKEFQEKFWNYFYNVPYIQSLVSPTRKYAKDCPRDPRYNDGRIIVDLEKPHILENMDYFRKTAITFEKTGKFTELKPNPNPNSEYYKWLKREITRCHYGMVRPSDGEWVTGDMYFYLNYMEMQLAEKTNNSKKASRVYKMPKTWDGVYYYFHYINQARDEGLHSGMLSSRGRSKSYIASSMLAKRFKLGESFENDRGCTCYITASDKKFLVAGDQTLDKFQHNIDFISQNTEWPGRQMLSNRLQDMLWTAGYKDLDLGNKGTGNSVVGISSNNDEEKLRGTRAILYVLEEAGTFARLNKVWANILPSVEQGQGEDRAVYGQILAFGTAGDKDSDFKAFANMLYHPKGFHIKSLKNVYDIEGKGGPIFSYFYPAYMNNEGCYDKNGNSDVTKALFQILKDRENVKNNSSDINAAMKRTAEYPIVPQEAILKIQGNRFPIEAINERIVELESNPHEYDDTLIGTLVQNPDGTVKFKPTEDDVIINYPLGDNKAHGALQIFKEPEKDANDRVYSERYVIGHDPINQDDAESKSLASFFVIDMWTESIAAEYTGRQDQENVFELGRLLCIYYNAQMLYESNNKMCYSYFSKMNCTYMLADTPEYLRERDIVKSTGYGNAHPYTEKVLTPNGWMLWKDIKIGDCVYGSDGYPTKVIDIPFDDEVDCYKITLRDGRHVECSSGHLFNVLDYNKLRKLLSVKQMIDKGIFRVRKHNKNNTIYKESKFYIPVNPCIEYEEKHVDINPYFLGLMIGDGCFVHSKFNKCYFTSAEKDFAVYYSVLNYPYKKVDDRHYKVEYPNFGCYAEKYGLRYSKARDKFIPDIYKYNSKQIRLELIQGLFDTDGTTNSMETSYTTVSRQLGLDVMEVLRSLGINCNMRISYNKYGPIYSVVAYTSIPLFKLPRKRNIQGGCRSRHTKIGITNIQYIGKKRAKCITVENSDGLYLISDFILTHNSAKGIAGTVPMNNHEDDLIEQWLKLPKTKYETNQEGEEVAVTIRNVQTIRNLALLKELSLYGIEGNYDRVRALGITLVLRNAYVTKYGGDVQSAKEEDVYDVYNDDFFKRNGFI